MRNLTAAVRAVALGKLTRRIGMLVVLAAVFFSVGAGAAQVDVIVQLFNIPSVDLDLAPTPAFTFGTANCTRGAVVRATATAEAACPNGSPAVNEAAVRGVVGGPEVQSSGITYHVLSGLPIHQEFSFAPCTPELPERRWQVSSFENCNGNPTVPQPGYASCTTPGIFGECPTGTSPDPITLLCCRAATQQECGVLNYFWNFENATCYVTAPSPSTSDSCRAVGWFWDSAHGACGNTIPTTPQTCYEHSLYWNYAQNYCSVTPAPCPDQQYQCADSWLLWDEWQCGCFGTVPSPVLVDVAGDGFALTDAAGGVLFDISRSGRLWRVAWTAPGSDDAWLALDRDANGKVDGGHELFGNVTPQPSPRAGGERQGFIALAEYDRQARGGNGDGLIDGRDAVFASLRLWRDADHDGVSQPSELFTLPALDVVRLHLDYKESKRVDEHGNQFRYRAKADDAKGAKAGRWAWDVFLTRAP